MKKINLLSAKINRKLMLKPYNISELGSVYVALLSGFSMYALLGFFCWNMEMLFLWDNIKVLVFVIMTTLWYAWYRNACNKGLHDPKSPTRYGNRIFPF